MKDFNNFMKVISGSNEKDIESAIELWIATMMAFLNSMLVNKTLVAKFIVANRSIIIGVVQFVINMASGIAALIPQFDILARNFDQLEKDWDDKGFQAAGDDIEDSGMALCKQVGDRLGIEYDVFVKATWIQDRDCELQRKVMWMGYMPSNIFNGKDFEKRSWLEDKVMNNNFDFSELVIKQVSRKEKRKSVKVEVKFENVIWIESKMPVEMFVWFMEHHGQGKHESMWTELVEFFKKINPKFTEKDEVYIRLV